MKTGFYTLSFECANNHKRVDPNERLGHYYLENFVAPTEQLCEQQALAVGWTYTTVDGAREVICPACAKRRPALQLAKR